MLYVRTFAAKEMALYQTALSKILNQKEIQLKFVQYEDNYRIEQTI